MAARTLQREAGLAGHPLPWLKAEPSGAGCFLRVKAAKSPCFIQELRGVAGAALTGVTTVQVRD